MRIEAIVERLAAAGPAAAPAPTLAVWRQGFRIRDDSFVTAFEAGLTAGNLAFCFAAGYQAALRRLLPSLPDTAFAALLVTEGKNQRPQDLQTLLTPAPQGGFLLDGNKSWVAGGAQATHLLVLARSGHDVDGRPQSALVLLPTAAPGVTLEPRPANGFLDAVPHARAHFERVPVTSAMCLPGDGWRDYARPFRTLEDIHVSVAIAAWLAVNARRRVFPDAWQATLASCLDRLAACASRAPGDPLTHLLLAAAEQELATVAAQVAAHIAADDDDFARDWRTNGMLLALAAPARAKRLEKAARVLRS